MTEWFDALVFLGESRYRPGVSIDLAEQLARRSDTSFLCATSMPPDRGLREANLRVLAQCSGSSGRASALARIDPLEPGAAETASELMGLGFAGLLLDPWRDSYCISDCAALDLLMDATGGAPVVVEAGFPWVSEPLQLAEFAARNPGTPVVATRGLQMNMSGLSIEAATAALERSANLHMLTSGVYRQDWLIELTEEGFADRMLFASMSPVFHPELERGRIMRLHDAAVRSSVMSGNAARIFERS